MQIVHACVHNEVARLSLPAAEAEVLPGVSWGRVDHICTPAFWVALSWTSKAEFSFKSTDGTLEQEVAFCLLGGFGVTAELATAAYDRLISFGMFNSPRVSEERLYTALSAPLSLNGRTMRYRFPKQRAMRISNAINFIRTRKLPTNSDRQFRGALMEIPGVGPKTASWITRNWLGSDEIAILDIHVMRAGLQIGLFPKSSRLPADYFHLERRFLTFAAAVGVRASILDAIIWSEMRTISRLRKVSS